MILTGETRILSIRGVTLTVGTKCWGQTASNATSSTTNLTQIYLEGNLISAVREGLTARAITKGKFHPINCHEGRGGGEQRYISTLFNHTHTHTHTFSSHLRQNSARLGYKHNELMSCREIVPVYCENHTMQRRTLCGVNIQAR
jgi:hypothetical protein